MKKKSEGIGRKVQRKIADLEKRIEIADLKEKAALSSLEQISKEYEMCKKDKETYENMVIILF